MKKKLAVVADNTALAPPPIKNPGPRKRRAAVQSPASQPVKRIRLVVSKPGKFEKLEEDKEDEDIDESDETHELEETGNPDEPDKTSIPASLMNWMNLTPPLSSVISRLLQLTWK